MLARNPRLAIAGLIAAAAIAVPTAALASGSGSPSPKPARPQASAAAASKSPATSRLPRTLLPGTRRTRHARCRPRTSHRRRRRACEQRHRRGTDGAARVDIHAGVSAAPERRRSPAEPAGISAPVGWSAAEKCVYRWFPLSK